MKKILLSCLLVVATIQLWGQQNTSCSATDVHNDCINTVDDYLEMYNQMNDEIYEITAEQSTTIITEDYTIPVVFHLLHAPNQTVGNGSNISNEQAYQCIDFLNQAFSNTGSYFDPEGIDIGFEFCLAQYDPDGNETNGINRIVSTSYNEVTLPTDEPEVKTETEHWNPYLYLNIYVVNSICQAGNCNIAGYAYPAVTHGSVYDGIVIKAPFAGATFNGTKTLIHEVGHYFNLLHPFDNGCGNNDCLADNDRVCDTPPDASNEQHACSNPPNTCITDIDDTSMNNPYRPITFGGLGDQHDMIDNYMDYGYNNCKTRFTIGQRQRMVITLEEYRASLLQNTACFAAPAPLGCITPVNIEVSDIEENQVNISWNDVIGATGYRVFIKQTNSSVWNSSVINQPGFVLENLQGGTSYQFKVQAICGNDESAESNITTFVTTTNTVTCQVPTNLNASNIQVDEVSLSWASTNANQYEVNFRKVGLTNWEGLVYFNNNLSIQGLESGTTYQARVRSLCNTSNSAFSAIISFTTLSEGSCDTPLSVFVSGIAANSVNLNWTAIGNSSDYTVAYKPISSTNWQYKTANNAQTSLNGLTGNTSYQVKVRANCGAGVSSSYSQDQFFTTLQQSNCNLPSGLYVDNITTSTAVINWVGAGGVLNYTVAHHPQNPAQEVYNLTASTTYELTNLQANTTYFVRVRSNCMAGSSAYSNYISFQTDAEFEAPEECAIPANLSVNNITHESASVSWLGSNDADYYNVLYKTNSQSSFETATSTNTNFALTDLLANTYYQVRVQAICGGVPSAFTTLYYFVTEQAPLLNCETPENILVTSITESGATISWANEDLASNYKLFIKVVGSSNYQPVNTSVTNYTFNNLQSDTEYEIRLQSQCLNQFSGLSAAQYFTTLPVAVDPNCFAPSIIEAEDITANSAAISWNIVNEANFYSIRYRVQNDDDFIYASSVSNSISLNNLESGTTYELAASSMCGSLITDYSNPIYFTTLVQEEQITCATPSNIQINNITETQATISWSAVENAQTYIIGYLGGSSQYNFATSFVNSTVLTGLSPNTTYIVKVKTFCDSYLDSDFSFNYTFTTLAQEVENQACNHPKNIITTGVSSNSISLAWDEVSGATQYVVFHRLIGGNWIIDYTVNNSFSIENLQSSTNYQIKMKTICLTDVSDSSPIINVSTDEVFVPPVEDDCLPPSGFELDFVDENSAMISWENSVNSNIYLITIYNAQNESADIFETGSFSTFTQFTELEAGTTYWVRLRSNCGSELSDFSAWYNFTTLGQPQTCDTPSNLFATFETENSVELNWAANNNADAYNVEITETLSNTSNTILVATNNIEASGLNSCTDYSFRVQAICDGNMSDYSDSENFATLCPPEAEGNGLCPAEGESIAQGYIQQVKIGSIVNASGNDDGYGNYETFEMLLNSTGSNVFILNSNNPYQQYYWGIWIDSNNDGEFDFDGDEQLYYSDGPKSGTVGGFMSSGNGSNNNSLIRIIMSKLPISDPCADVEFGEIEDYSVTIN